MSSPGIKKTIENYEFGEFRFVLERIVNLDDLVDEISDDVFNEDERLPYWAELWPSAIGLGRYIAKNKDYFSGKSILELGCGLGLTTICLAKCCPAEFLTTDYEADALNSMHSNFMINEMTSPETMILDWRQPEIDRGFELIIASDVLYESRFFTPLLDLFEMLLLPKGNIIIAEPNRNLGQKFFEMAQQRSYFLFRDVEIVNQDGKDIHVNICLLRK